MDEQIAKKMVIVRGIIMRQTDLEIPHLQTNQTNYNGESLNKSSYSLWYLYFVMHSSFSLYMFFFQSIRNYTIYSICITLGFSFPFSVKSDNHQQIDLTRDPRPQDSADPRRWSGGRRRSSAAALPLWMWYPLRKHWKKLKKLDHKWFLENYLHINIHL